MAESLSQLSAQRKPACHQGRQRQQNLGRYLALILIFAAGIRLYWAFTQTHVIEGEGAEYASIARNLLKGKGYVGSLGEGTQLLFPPLYPLLIAAYSPLTGDLETAGRLVSVTFGTLLLLPIYFISRRIYNRKVGMMAAILAACHPLLVRLSASVYSEAVFLTLVMAGTYWSLQSLSLRRIKDCALSGACFGLAYLTRPEAMGYPLLLVFSLLSLCLFGAGRLKRATLLSGIVLGSFLIVAVPYMLFLSLQVGQFRLEGKSSLNYTIAERMNAGMSYGQASYGLSKDLKEEGPVLNPNTFIKSSGFPRTSFGSIIQNIIASAKRNVEPLYGILFCSAFGSPILCFLVAIGLFRNPWSAQRLTSEGFLALCLGFQIAVLIAMNELMFRYAFPVLPFLIVWAAQGLSEIGSWAKRTQMAIMGTGLLSSRVVDRTARTLLLVGTLGFAGYGSRAVAEFELAESKYQGVKDAGLWLGRYAPGPKTIMDVEPIVSFYASGTLFSLPFSDSSTCLRYIEGKAPDFIVLKGREINSRPFVAGWLKDSIPSGRAKLIYRVGDNLEDTIVIYRWMSKSSPDGMRVEETFARPPDRSALSNPPSSMPSGHNM
jgi:4-amino-4-deoxy-L-arabinose transferase-like glycosyltransferase